MSPSRLKLYYSRVYPAVFFALASTIFCVITLSIVGCVTTVSSTSVATTEKDDPRNGDFKRMLDQYSIRMCRLGADKCAIGDSKDELQAKNIRFEKGADGTLNMKFYIANQPDVRAESIRLRIFFHDQSIFWGEHSSQFPPKASIKSVHAIIAPDNTVSIPIPGTSELYLHGEHILPFEIRDNRIAGTAMWLRTASSSRSFTILIDEISPDSANLTAKIDGSATYRLVEIQANESQPGRTVPMLPSARGPQLTNETRLSFGTGFVFSNDGYLVTNYHVISGAKKISIQQQLPNGISSRKNAKVVKIDRLTDLAILRVEDWSPPLGAYSIPPAIAPSSSCKVGDSVFVIGYPLPDTLSSNAKFTKGDISDLAGIRNDRTRLQHTAAIQPGNSGGPTCLSDGRVVGVVVSSLDEMSTLRRSGALPQGVNFSIKSDMLLKLIEECGINIDMQHIKSDPVSHVIDYTVQVVAEK